MEDDSIPVEGIVAKSAYKMDKAIAPVMPDRGMCHARIMVAGRDLSEKQREEVLKHTRHVVEKHGHPSVETAEKVIEKLGY